MSGMKIIDQNGKIHKLVAISQDGWDWTKIFTPREGDAQLWQEFDYDEDLDLYTGEIDDIRWWQAEIDAYNEEFERVIKYTRKGFQTLRELMEFLKEADDLGWHWHQDPVKSDDMELFGGQPPHNTIECWSWDEYDVLVGRNANELEIISRVEWNLRHEK
jgi:hypothetical protein